MHQIKLNESTAARRRIPIFLTSPDGFTPATGITLSAGDMKLSKNGASESNHAGTLTELATGSYYYEPTQGECDTIGFLFIKIAKSSIRTYLGWVQIVSFDPYDAVKYGLTNLGDIYTAKIDLARDNANTRDEYTVTWFKNGIRVTSGITSPTIQVVKRADGTDLIASTAMTQIGSTGSYKYDEATNRITVGEAAVVLVGATIDGSAREYSMPVSRDS